MSTPAAADIDECIEFAPSYVALCAYGSISNLPDQFALWVAGMFKTPDGIFIPADGDSATVRRITNWYPQHVLTAQTVDSTCTPLAVSQVVNALDRVLNAVRDAGTTQQKSDVTDLFNTCWAIDPPPPPPGP